MSDDKKFTEEELKSLRDLQDSYTKKQAELGQVSVQRILLNQQMDTLDERQAQLESEYTQVQQQEQDLVKKLNEKYGPGQLNPETGVFTPNN
jgi:flagellar biosynthesis chaperone FliJ|tara:strand:+ start:128 stop:403 length:276 start_codon:yes stop_codon:yes gene_type:complete